MSQWFYFFFLDLIIEHGNVLMPGVTVLFFKILILYFNVDYISIDMYMDEDVLGP